jgi:hypothetical protein
MERIGVGKLYRIKVTPSVCELAAGKLALASPQEIDAPIFVDDAANCYPLYINGNVIGPSNNASFDLSLIDALKDSLNKNPTRYAVPQKSRRAIFACNLKGAHARDIFEEPIHGVPYTRLFMRSVDTKAIDLGLPSVIV